MTANAKKRTANEIRPRPGLGRYCRTSSMTCYPHTCLITQPLSHIQCDQAHNGRLAQPGADCITAACGEFTLTATAGYSQCLCGPMPGTTCRPETPSQQPRRASADWAEGKVLYHITDTAACHQRSCAQAAHVNPSQQTLITHAT